MTRGKLFDEGARLPEELSRLLFLEPVLAGRRVLEVGARSDAVARFLIELGATRVVCASDDKDLVELLRAENDLDKVDFRVIRPGVLPGDDGAFDLVIDFSLPDALAAGQTFRLTDIGRLLSDDGFAITTLRNTSTRGLPTLLGGEARQSEPVADGRSAAGLSHHAGPVTYRALVEALKLQFELVQVYFQSLLLGYLFGSFDVEPKDDGVAPNTSLMGTEPEPAGHYLFTFGNAVPVIEDVALVQVPFSDLLEVVRSRGPVPAPGNVPEPVPAPDSRTTAEATATHSDIETASAIETAPEEEPVPLPGVIPLPGSDTGVSDDVVRLREENESRERALVQIAGRIERLRGDVDGLVTALERRTAERDELAVFVEGLEAAVVARDSMADALRGELAAIHARSADLENAARAGGEVAESAVRALAEIEALQDERAKLVEHIASLEGEAVTLRNRQRVLEEAHELSVLRVKELEDTLLTLESERGRLVAEVGQVATEASAELARVAEERRAERDMFEAAAATHQAQLAGLERALDEARQALLEMRRTHDETSQEAQRARLLEDRARELEAALEEARKEAARARRAEQDKAFLEERTQTLEAQVHEAAAVQGELEARRRAMEELTERLRAVQSEVTAEREAASSELTRLRDEVQTLSIRRDELEADAGRLAEGVKTLVHEREQNKARYEAAEAHLEGMARELHAAREQLAATSARLDELQGHDEGREKRLRAAHAALEEARRELNVAREGLQEVAGQRDTLKHVVAARERELQSVKDELHAATAERSRLEEQSDTQQKALADARQRLSAVEVERQQQKRREEELGRAHLEASGSLAETQRLLEEARAALVAKERAQEAALADLRGSLVGELEHIKGALEAARGEIHAAHADRDSARDELRALVADKDSAHADVAELRRKLEAMEGDGMRLLGDLEEEGRQKSEALSRAEALHEELQGVLADRDRVTNDLRTLEDETARSLASAEDERRRLEEDVARLRGELESAHASIEDARRELSARADEQQALLSELAEQRRTAAEQVLAFDEERAAHREVLAVELKRIEHEQLTTARLEGRVRELEATLATERDASASRVDDVGAQVARAEEELAAARALHEEEKRATAQAEARIGVLEGSLDEAQRRLAAEEARANVLSATLEEAQRALETESARAELLRASLTEARSLLDVERARGDLFHEELVEAHVALSRERARGDLFANTLHEAHGTLGRERTRGDLFQSQLDEAHETLVRERARGDVLKADLEEAQDHIFALRAKARAIIEDMQAREATTGARAELAQDVLGEAQARLEAEKARADLLGAQLVEAQQGAEAAQARAQLLAAELDDARATFTQRRAAYEAALDAEHVRAAAALNDATAAAEAAKAATEAARAAADKADRISQVVAQAEERVNDAQTFAQHEGERAARAEEELQSTRADFQRLLTDHETSGRATGQAIAGLEEELKELKERLAQQRSDDMLLAADRERLSAMVASAERERDALLGDLGAHQQRANAEAARRLAVEEELTKLRVAHNTALGDVQRMKADLEAGKKAPEVEAELQSLKERIDALEKAGATKDAKIAEQADRINRLTERLVREAGMA